MAASTTSFAKGKSGNPRGRPPKSRALTEILASAGKTKVLREGKEIPAQKLIAENLWRALVSGVIQLENGKTLAIANAEEYMGIVKFLHTQIDGPPPAALAVDLTSQGQPLAISMVEVIKTTREPQTE